MSQRLRHRPCPRPTPAPGQLQAALIGALLLASTAPIQAQTAGDELGRLFFTPEKRQTLDNQRELGVQENVTEPDNLSLTINGVVSRSSGKRTVWVNGVAQNEQDRQYGQGGYARNLGVSITPDRKNPAQVVVRSPDVSPESAAVGDTVDRMTGEATPLLNGGKIRIHAKGR